MNDRKGSNKCEGTSLVKDLNKGSVLRVSGNRAGQSIRCLNGMVWITQQGHNGGNKDRFLNSGNKYFSSQPCFVLIQALNDSRVMICPEGEKRSIGWFPRIRQRVLSHA